MSVWTLAVWGWHHTPTAAVPENCISIASRLIDLPLNHVTSEKLLFLIAGGGPRALIERIGWKFLKQCNFLRGFAVKACVGDSHIELCGGVVSAS